MNAKIFINYRKELNVFSFVDALYALILDRIPPIKYLNWDLSYKEKLLQERPKEVHLLNSLKTLCLRRVRVQPKDFTGSPKELSVLREVLAYLKKPKDLDIGKEYIRSLRYLKKSIEQTEYKLSKTYLKRTSMTNTPRILRASIWYNKTERFSEEIYSFIFLGIYSRLSRNLYKNLFVNIHTEAEKKPVCKQQLTQQLQRITDRKYTEIEDVCLHTEAEYESLPEGRELTQNRQLQGNRDTIDAWIERKLTALKAKCFLYIDRSQEVTLAQKDASNFLMTKIYNSFDFLAQMLLTLFLNLEAVWQLHIVRGRQHV